jgi:hypothetical protein
MRDKPVSWCGTGATATFGGGAKVAFAGGRSKPRFGLIGVDVEPLNVARTNAGTTQSAATVTRMATRARPAILIEERPLMLLEGRQCIASVSKESTGEPGK